jgi:phosphopantothenoylcysteine decarboxylase/phosphopantothenate--cysteine ligase
MASHVTRARHMLITAGPTHEPIDAVRYIANRSSGRMGLALAEAARDAGWNVTLLLGPVALEAPPGVRTFSFESAADLAALLEQHFSVCDVLIMAAAVADYRPRRVDESKLAPGAAGLTLELEATPDLVAACATRKRPNQRIIGFALEESPALEQRAIQKLQRKALDAIVANPLPTMGAADVTATVITATGGKVRVPSAPRGAAALSKTDFARWLIEWLDQQGWGTRQASRDRTPR